MTVPVKGHSYSSKFPYGLMLIVEIAHDVCCFGREVCRYFIDEIPICRVTFTGLDVPDDSTPPDLVIILRPGNLVNNHIGTVDWRIIVERPVTIHHKLFC